jgi:ATP-dependent RNA helicase DHX8/PRP22
MDDLAAFELLSLVSKITSELQNHTGINDRTLAEFIIAQHEKCSSIAEFKQSLDAMGAEFPQSLIESVDRLILTMHPKRKRKQSGHVEENGDSKISDEVDKKARIFKGLAIPDREKTWNEDELATDKSKPAVDDTFAQLESLADITSQPSRKRKHEGYRDHDRGRDRSNYHRLENQSGSHYGEKRRRSPPHSDFRRPPTPETDEYPILFKIYQGRVTGIKDFGAFVNLQGVKGSKVDGLVHVSAMQEGARVNHPSDLLSQEQPVYVKVVKIEGSRIGLSMKEVDQVTGRDLVPQKRIASGANMERLNGISSSDDYGNGVPVIEDGFDDRPKRNKKRLTSPERWEIRQLIASGVASASDYPDLEEEHNPTGPGEPGGLEEEVDVELVEDEPPFLQGQTKQSLELSPIRIVKAPDGSLNRAAMAGTALAKERREMKQQEAAEKAAEQASKTDLSSQWQDPMIAPEHRKFASDLRSAQPRKATDAMPEWRKATQNRESLGRRTDMTIKQQRESLPIFKFRKQLLEAISSNQVMIVVGETGSGKSTQLTQYLCEAGYAGRGKMVACTQPRRVAAMALAKRVSEELGSELGRLCGYKIRFEDVSGPETQLLFLTDGMLLNEMLQDPNLSKFGAVLVDEAHERSVSTDVVMGLLKKTLKRRPDLKVLVTSATMDSAKFSEYFGGCPIFSIPGRTFPVEILYSREPEADYLDAALTTIMQIHLMEPPGDILCFMTGQEDIETSADILEERQKALGPGVPDLLILPVYSGKSHILT